eukprot:1086667-Karenia_brevis.AAC.1
MARPPRASGAQTPRPEIPVTNRLYSTSLYSSSTAHAALLVKNWLESAGQILHPRMEGHLFNSLCLPA